MTKKKKTNLNWKSFEWICVTLKRIFIPIDYRIYTLYLSIYDANERKILSAITCGSFLNLENRKEAVDCQSEGSYECNLKRNKSYILHAPDKQT